MKIHTSLDYHAMNALLRASGAPISYRVLDQVGSRTHTYGYHVGLTGTGGRNNSGLYGAGDHNGATWDEWGAFFGALFEADPEARCGGTLTNPVYRDAGHFHYLTGQRFVKRPDYGTPGRRGGHLPADTHPRHQWELDRSTMGFNCRKCSATQSRHISGKDWS
jgi:hypothetical protein